MWRVGQSERFSTALQAEPLGEFEVAEDTHIQVKQAGPTNGIASNVAEDRPDRRRKHAGVEIRARQIARLTARSWSGADDMYRTVLVRRLGTARGSECAIGSRDGKWRAAHAGKNPVGLPTAGHGIQYPALRPTLPSPKRQFVHAVQFEVGRAVKAGKPLGLAGIGWEGEKQEVQLFIVSVVNGLGPGISNAEHRVSFEFPPDRGLQRIIVPIAERSQLVDVAPIAAKLDVQQARGIISAQWARIYVDVGQRAYAPRSHITYIGNKTGKLLPDGQVKRMRVTTTEVLGRGCGADTVGQWNGTHR